MEGVKPHTLYSHLVVIKKTNEKSGANKNKISGLKIGEMVLDANFFLIRQLRVHRPARSSASFSRSFVIPP